MEEVKKCWECGRELIEFHANYEVWSEEGEELSNGENEKFYACNHCKYLYTKNNLFLYTYDLEVEDGEDYVIYDGSEILDSVSKDFFPPDGSITVSYVDEKIDKVMYEKEFRHQIEEDRVKRRELEEKRKAEQEKDKLEFENEKEHKCWECGGTLIEIQRDYSELVSTYDDNGRKSTGWVKSENKGRFFVCKHCRFIYSEDGQLIHYSYILDPEVDSPNFEDADFKTFEGTFINKIQFVKYNYKVSKSLYTQSWRQEYFIEARDRARTRYLDSHLKQIDNTISLKTSGNSTLQTSVSGEQQQARCKYCGSTSLQAVKRGANVGGAATGFFLAGWLGALIGATKQSEAIDIICLNCKKIQ